MLNKTAFFRDEFFLWLSKKVSPLQLSEYRIAYVDIEEFCLQEKILERKLFETTDLKVIEDLISVMNSIKVYKKFRVKHGHNFSKVEAALKYYCEFLKLNKGSLSVDFNSKVSNDTNLEKKSDTSKENAVTVKSESTTETTERILSSKKAFKEWLKFKYTSESIAIKYLNLADTINKMLKDRGFITKDLYLITDSEQLRKIKDQLLGRLSLANLNFMTAFENLIEFRQNNSDEEKVTLESNSTAEIIPETPVKAEPPKVQNLSKIEKYAEILSKFFADDGYRIGFIIHRKKFKNRFLEEYGENLTETGEQIDEILSQLGTKRDDRIFPNQNEEQSPLIEVIVNDIVSAFDSGASAVFIEAVYDKYKQQLADNLKIYNEKDSTSILLKNANGKFFKYCGIYFNPREKKTDTSGDIVHFMQESHQPLSYSQIFKALWYIPRSKIEYLIKSQIKSIVCVANEMFFYAPNLPVDETELQKISSLIQSEIEFHGYITDAKMMELIKSKYPLIAMNLEGFSAYAVRKCLSYLLAESFSFNGSVISALGSQLNLSDVYADFARNHENLTLEELKNFAKELDNNILWYPVLSEMIRISQDNFVSRKLINFDVNLIDNCLEELYPQNYIPLKEINLLINLPSIGYAWNSYLLESYLYSFSRKFRLVHVSFSETGVYGAMVRVGSSITDYESLIIDALSHSDSLTESKALQFIVDQGYQQRKAYKNIDDVIKKAKLIKENRKRH